MWTKLLTGCNTMLDWILEIFKVWCKLFVIQSVIVSHKVGRQVKYSEAGNEWCYITGIDQPLDRTNVTGKEWKHCVSLCDKSRY